MVQHRVVTLMAAMHGSEGTLQASVLRRVVMLSQETLATPMAAMLSMLEDLSGTSLLPVSIRRSILLLPDY